MFSRRRKGSRPLTVSSLSRAALDKDCQVPRAPLRFEVHLVNREHNICQRASAQVQGLRPVLSNLAMTPQLGKLIVNT